MAQKGYALKYALSALRNDREVVLTAVKKDGGALEWASGRLRNDREVVLTAVAKNGCALRDASKALCNDREVVLTAVANDRDALKLVAKPLRFAAAVVVEWRRLRLLFLGQRDPGSPLSRLPIELARPPACARCWGLLQSVPACEVRVSSSVADV